MYNIVHSLHEYDYNSRIRSGYVVVCLNSTLRLTRYRSWYFRNRPVKFHIHTMVVDLGLVVIGYVVKALPDDLMLFH